MTTKDLSTPQASIASQLALLQAGDYEGLKVCLTERVRNNVTAEQVSKAKATAQSMTLETIAVKYNPVGNGIKIMMKNGRTLTTMVKVGNDWLADTIWFK